MIPKRLWYCLFASLLGSGFGAGCSKEAEKVDCSLVNLAFSVSVTDSECGFAQGLIAITPANGIAISRFQIDDQPFTSSGTFSNLAPGKYSVTVENDDGCSQSQTVFVKSGISFKESVEPIIAKSCAISSCHDGSGNIDYRVFSNFNPADMKARTQSRNMPKEGTLTQEEIDAIACWVDDGASNN